MNASIILTILCCTLIIAILGYCFYRMSKLAVQNEQTKSLIELKKQSVSEKQKLITPLRLQACERLILFLERLNPNHLILRCYQPGMNIKLLKDVMQQNIRDEFDHNLSQQLYISSETWECIRKAKEDMISLINSTLLSSSEETSVTEFAGKIFEQLAGKRSPIDIAIELLKKEVQKEFLA